jgi:hypothetical protein
MLVNMLRPHRSGWAVLPAQLGFELTGGVVLPHLPQLQGLKLLLILPDKNLSSLIMMPLVKKIKTRVQITGSEVIVITRRL